MNSLKKTIAYILISGVALLAVLGILAVWDLIDFEIIMTQMFYSTLIVLAASTVILIIIQVFLKDADKHGELPA